MAAWRNRHRVSASQARRYNRRSASRINLKSSAIRKVAMRNFRTAADLESDRTRHGALSWSILDPQQSILTMRRARLTHAR
jgi:hypothetical protein